MRRSVAAIITGVLLAVISLEASLFKDEWFQGPLIILTFVVTVMFASYAIDPKLFE